MNRSETALNSEKAIDTSLRNDLSAKEKEDAALQTELKHERAAEEVSNQSIAQKSKEESELREELKKQVTALALTRRKLKEADKLLTKTHQSARTSSMESENVVHWGRKSGHKQHRYGHQHRHLATSAVHHRHRNRHQIASSASSLDKEIMNLERTIEQQKTEERHRRTRQQQRLRHRHRRADVKQVPSTDAADADIDKMLESAELSA